MNAYLNYALEANIGLLLFLGLYMILFRNENEFALKRLYLLAGIVISLTLPLVHISSPAAHLIPSVSNSFPGNWLPEITIWADPATLTQATTIWQWIFIIYASVTLLLLARMIWQLLSLGLFIRNSSRTTSGGFQLIESSHNLTAFSFFHFIILGKGPFSPEEKSLIIKHESIHARRMHSVDMLLLHGLTILFWFNPCVYFYRNILCDIHEFEADALTAGKEQGSVYSGLLARAALVKINFSLANHFNRSITLKRLAMLNSLHKKINSWKWVLSVMMAGVFFLVVACQEQVRTNSEAKADEVYTVVEEMAAPPEGMIKFYEFIATNLKYPAQARELGVEGKVFVEFTIQKDGSITDVNVKQGIGAGCDKAAMDVISQSSKWKPAQNAGQEVAMKMVIPILFKLGN